MSLYRAAWPFISRVPAEFAHRLGMRALAWRLTPMTSPVADPFTWGGVTFPNRMGIAAGLDKDAECLPGLSDLGVGFVEVGTVLVAPWGGQTLRPRMDRLLAHRGIWNRLGFPSEGVDAVATRLARFRHGPLRERMRVGANIGPHPGHLRTVSDAAGWLTLLRKELTLLVQKLHRDVDFFVINLTSPNTPGLRAALQNRDLPQQVLAPVKEALAAAAADADRTPPPVLLKLPPEDQNVVPWTPDSLAGLLGPVLELGVADGFVATNTSIGLSRALSPHSRPDAPGGVSGAPLTELARRTVETVRRIAGDRVLLIGCGGVMSPADAVAMRSAGADLVEAYSGLIYGGPRFPSACARAMKGGG
jgi:dihydroorotate dehydrogenase